MKKLISRQTHGVADYSYAALFAAALYAVNREVDFTPYATTVAPGEERR